MKKLLMVLAFAGVSVATMAQDAVPTEKYSVSTNSFWSNWFVQAHLQGSSFYCNEEYGLKLDKSPFKGYRTNLGVSLAVGKYFTPGLALRLKAFGIWGRATQSTDKKTNATKYLTIAPQAMFNLANMIWGYNEDRKIDFGVFTGFQGARNFTYNTYAMGINAGLFGQYKINRKLNLDLEIGYYLYEPDFSGKAGSRSCTKGGINKLKNKDHQFAVEFGLTYNLGTATFNKTPDVEAIKALSQGQIDALNAQLADAQSENARLKDLLANQQGQGGQGGGIGPVTTVTKVIGAPVSVFFNIGKSNIVSQKDMQNIEAVAEAAKDNNTKILVTGYADSKTGSADFNQALSQKRADAVVDALVNMGVSRDNIETAAAGGVDTLSPISFNRRATVELK